MEENTINTLQRLGGALVDRGVNELFYEQDKAKALEELKIEQEQKLKFEEQMKKRKLGRYAETGTKATAKGPSKNAVARERDFLIRSAAKQLGLEDEIVDVNDDFGRLPLSAQRAINDATNKYERGEIGSMADALTEIAGPAPGTASPGSSSEGAPPAPTGSNIASPGVSDLLSTGASKIGEMAGKAGTALMDAGFAAGEKVAGAGYVAAAKGAEKGKSFLNRIGSGSGLGTPGGDQQLPPQAKKQVLEISAMDRNSPTYDQAVRNFVEQYGEALARQEGLI